MKKYNLSEIMHKAWKLYRKGVGSFAEALHRAWNSAKAAPFNAQRPLAVKRRFTHRAFSGRHEARMNQGQTPCKARAKQEKTALEQRTNREVLRYEN